MVHIHAGRLNRLHTHTQKSSFIPSHVFQVGTISSSRSLETYCEVSVFGYVSALAVKCFWFGQDCAGFFFFYNQITCFQLRMVMSFLRHRATEWMYTHNHNHICIFRSYFIGVAINKIPHEREKKNILSMRRRAAHLCF